MLNHRSTWAISATANSGRNFRRLLIGDFTGSSWSIPCWDDHQHGLPCRSTAENAWFFFGFCLHIYPTLNKNAGAQPQFQLPTGLCLSHLLRGLLWSIGPISQRIWSDLPENSPWNTKKRQFNSHWSSIVNISTNQKKHVEKKSREDKPKSSSKTKSHKTMEKNYAWLYHKLLKKKTLLLFPPGLAAAPWPSFQPTWTRQPGVIGWWSEALETPGPPWGPQPEVLGTVPLWLRITHLSA